MFELKRSGKIALMTFDLKRNSNLFYTFTKKHKILKNELKLFACFAYHTCKAGPLAPDPIRVQSCVCCLF